MSPFDIFIPILINPLINVLLAFYKLAEGIGLPGPLGWAIIFLTVAIRLLIYPMYTAQLKSQKKMADLKPHLDEVRRKHGHDRKRHAEEQMKLFSKHGVSPAGGCLPLIVQTIVLLGLLYALLPILSIPAGEALQKLNQIAYSPTLHLDSFDANFLGLNLASSPSQVGPGINLGFFTLHLGLWWVPVITGLLQFVLSKMLQLAPPAKPKKNEAPSFQEALAQSQGSLLLLFPFLIGITAYTFPLGLSLYWNITSVFAIIQQYLTIGPGGLKGWLPKSLIPLK
jgi:YidC/Oxa1 family membrane protein insertase